MYLLYYYSIFFLHNSLQNEKYFFVSLSPSLSLSIYIHTHTYTTFCLFIHLSVDIWVASTPLVTVNNAPMKMSVQLSLQKHISFPEKSI